MSKQTKILCTLALLLALVIAFWSNVTEAAKICPDGKSYRRDLCKETREKADGSVEVYPQGKSYKRDETMVGKPQSDGSMRFCPKGKSYKRDECWVMK